MEISDRIIYGTMRMLSVKRTLSKWTYIFDELFEKGVRSFHISKEYDSYDLFLGVLKKSNFNKKKINIYAKCFSPNFNEKFYDEKKLNILLNSYLKDLSLDRINIQWMWRADLNSDMSRCKSFHQKIPEIDYSLGKIKKKSVNEIYCFPYSINFAKLVIKIKNINGLSVYFNPIEKSYKKFLGNKNIGIRPLYGGKLTSKYTFSELINFSLNEKKITKIVLSINKVKNLKHFYNFLNA